MPIKAPIDVKNFYDPETDRITRDISTQEWIALTGCSAASCQHYIKSGFLKTYKIGGARKIRCGSANEVRDKLEFIDSDTQAA